MSKQTFKLCYVHHNILYFTDSFEKQWGDDWDDAPYRKEWAGLLEDVRQEIVARGGRTR